MTPPPTDGGPRPQPAAPASRPRRRLLGGLAVLPLVGLAACDRGSPRAASFKGVDITGADYARRLELSDADGRARSLADFKGKVTVVFFGYTQCPDVCPSTLGELAQVKRALGADGERVQGVFVSVDPARDTPEVLKAYMASFDPGFVALRGTPEQTLAAAKEFKVYYAKVPGKTESSYTMDHTAGSFVFDASGRVRLFVRYGTGAEALTADLRALLDEAKAAA
ncbi:cytochrome oxidase biogenesis protein Sco1/SenC/PrrC [Piscinibacter sakaiensis]|uniref:Cytochrome oxidase biogenesis protein Sco1/SenC/PrrC n=1 Tax=Piscinibacter sakaiensis TaxID=1547922 RepID=A0A0K8P1A5_PISS1|nr:cytochrome oxidase biogenesis protein Sco1/SenC/PrrC [Piscinibacter sakaiensis]